MQIEQSFVTFKKNHTFYMADFTIGEFLPFVLRNYCTSANTFMFLDLQGLRRLGGLNQVDN